MQFNEKMMRDITRCTRIGLDHTLDLHKREYIPELDPATPALNEVLVHQLGHIRQERRVEFEQGDDSLWTYDDSIAHASPLGYVPCLDVPLMPASAFSALNRDKKYRS